MILFFSSNLVNQVNSQTLMFFMGFAFCASSEQIGGPGHFFEKAIAAGININSFNLRFLIYFYFRANNNNLSFL